VNPFKELTTAQNVLCVHTQENSYYYSFPYLSQLIYIAIATELMNTNVLYKRTQYFIPHGEMTERTFSSPSR